MRSVELLGPRPGVYVMAQGRNGGTPPRITVQNQLTIKGYSECPLGMANNNQNYQTCRAYDNLVYERNKDVSYRFSHFKAST